MEPDVVQLDLHLLLRVEIVDGELLAKVSPPAVATTAGGLTTPNDEMRVASVLGTVLLGLRPAIQAQAGVRIAEVEALDVGRAKSDG